MLSVPNEILIQCDDVVSKLLILSCHYVIYSTILIKMVRLQNRDKVDISVTVGM